MNQIVKPTTSLRGTDYGLLATIIGAVFLVYSNVYPNKFVYDDDILIIHNQFIRSWHYIGAAFTTSLTSGANISGSYYRPFQQLLYTFLFHISGLSTVAFHLLGVGLHAANACLMFMLGRKLQFHKMGVFAASLLWAVHPIETEAITYMSATADPLYAFFCLAGAVVLLPDFSTRRIITAIFLFVTALMSKEGAIIFPLLAAGLIYYKNHNRFDPRSYFCLWPFAAIAAAYVALHILIFASIPSMPPARIPATPNALSAFMPFAVWPVYLGMLLWPLHLYMGHIANGATTLWRLNLIGGLIIMSASVVQILRTQRQTFLPFSWGLVWFFAAFLPSSSFGDILYEHWLYLPTVGLFLGTAQTLNLWLTNKLQPNAMPVYCSKIILLGLCGALGFLTWQQNTVWHDTSSLLNNVIAQRHGPAPEAHMNIGIYDALNGNYDEALKEYDAAEKDFESSTNYSTLDSRAILQNDIAMTLLNMPDAEAHQDEARQHLQKAIQLDPNYYQAYKNLADLYLQLGNKESAEPYLQKAEDLKRRYKTAP